MMSTIYIDGMRSVHCARAVYTSLAGVAGIDRAEVSIGAAVIEHEGVLDETVVADAIARVGYALRVVVTDRRRLPVHLPPPDGAIPPAAPGTGRREGESGT